MCVSKPKHSLANLHFKSIQIHTQEIRNRTKRFAAAIANIFVFFAPCVPTRNFMWQVQNISIKVGEARSKAEVNAGLLHVRANLQGKPDPGTSGTPDDKPLCSNPTAGAAAGVPPDCELDAGAGPKRTALLPKTMPADDEAGNNPLAGWPNTLPAGAAPPAGGPNGRNAG
jgi:hypothetical protein